MPSLLDFSPEVICIILDHLAPDSPSLDALCLVGNRNLLALTRPYTWMEVNMVLGAEGRASARTAERLEAFVTDPAKVRAVRSLNIRLVGPYICRMPAILLLIEKLDAFVNVTHASFDCIRSQNVWGWQTPGRLVRHAVEVLSSLRSITVVGCNANEEELENMKDFREESEPPLPVPKLTHVTTRFCHPNLAGIWQQCRNIRVLEMEGGDPEDFWRHTVATEEIPKVTEDSTNEEIEIEKSLSKFWGYKGSETGLYSLLTGPYYRDDDDADEDEDYIIPFEVAERINIKSDAPPGKGMPKDVYSLTRYLERSVGDPPQGLRELAISLAFNVETYRICLHGMRGPKIERLGIVLSHRGHWVETEFDQLVMDLKNSERNNGTVPFFSKFESLVEFNLPCDGVSAASMDTLAELLSHAPALQHLWLDTADDPHLLSAAAQKYGERILTLRSVSWKNQATFEGTRNNPNLLAAAAGMYSECILTLKSVSWKNQATFEVKRSGGVEVLRKPYAAPMWQEWRGIGKWWAV